jgi:TetR/AcrR family transcriptional repressor of nem operon
MHAGDLDSTANAEEIALALQNLLIGLNTMSKVVRDEGQLWGIAKTTLKGLNLFKQIEAQAAA